MKKLKYQGGITKRITTRIANKNRKKFANQTEDTLRSLIQKFDRRQANFELASLSSRRDFPEQLLSILSFERFVGQPISWTVCSDGSHTPGQIETLHNLFPYIKIWKINFEDPHEVKKYIKARALPYFDLLFHYARNHPFGKKLFYYLNYHIKNPTLFLDSDVLFHDFALEGFKRVERYRAPGWYLPDQVWGCLDSRYPAKDQPQAYQVNAGFFLLNQEIENLAPGMDFLKSLNETYENFSEQTIFHILLPDHNFMPFDPRIFILNSGDQFDFSYIADKNKIAVRHYTGPVRHKMWQREWREVLSVDKF